MVLCRNAMFAFQQPLMLLIHIVPVQTKGLWDYVHLKSWKWCKKAFKYILKNPQRSDAMFPDTEDIERKKNIVQQWVCFKPAVRQAWDCFVFPPPPLPLLHLHLPGLSRAAPAPPAPADALVLAAGERPQSCSEAGALRLWQGPPANSLISLKPSTIVFSCACVALERQGVAGTYICLIWTIRHFSEALQSYCS